MRTLPASEIKRRGIIAIEEILGKGPVYVVKNSRPAFVALSEAEYSRLAQEHQPIVASSVWNILLAKPRKGKLTRRSVDARIKVERDSWHQR